MLRVVRGRRSLHLSIVGGEPLVRFRELNVLLPRLSEMGVAVQLVTSAVRRMPPASDAAGKKTARVFGGPSGRAVGNWLSDVLSGW